MSNLELTCGRMATIALLSLLVFVSIGPLAGGHVLSFSPFVGVVYGVGAVPAAMAGLLFLASFAVYVKKHRKLPVDGVVRGVACGVVSLTLFLLAGGLGESALPWEAWVFLEVSACLGGAASGGIARLLIRRVLLPS